MIIKSKIDGELGQKFILGLILARKLIAQVLEVIK
jgi:hypothetical protein